jgi:hypothetical protein
MGVRMITIVIVPGPPGVTTIKILKATASSLHRNDKGKTNPRSLIFPEHRAILVLDLHFGAIEWNGDGSRRRRRPERYCIPGLAYDAFSSQRAIGLTRAFDENPFTSEIGRRRERLRARKDSDQAGRQKNPEKFPGVHDGDRITPYVIFVT